MKTSEVKKKRKRMSSLGGRSAAMVAVMCLITAVLVLFTGGCSQMRPMPNDRQGLLDYFSTLEEVGAPVRKGRGGLWGGSAAGVSSRELARLQTLTEDWVWPLERVQVTSEFGERGDRQHEGVDLRARVGTPVRAVAPGRVVYSGRKISGYGNMVVIQHKKAGLFSVYAHHKKNLVRKGQRVKKGQKIALSGRTGRVSGPHLHFEVRRGVVPVDPQALIQGRRLANKRYAIPFGVAAR